MRKFALSVLLLVAITLSGCTGKPVAQQPDAELKNNAQAAGYEEGLTTRVVALKGATTMGLVKLIHDAENSEHYQAEMYTTADEIVPLIAKGEADIALVPANLAAMLYQKTEGGVSVIDLNTLSVLEVLSGNDSIQSLTDLAGKTVYMTGKGTVPEYSLRYVLEKSDLSMEDLTIEFKTEPTEVVSALAQNPQAVGILPQPFATVALMQNDTLHNVLHLGEVWEQVASDGSQLVTGVTIVRTAFLEEHPSAVNRFLEDHAASVDYVNANPSDAAALVEEYGIIKAPIAERAIPSCNLVCITGEDMKTALSGYLQALYELSPDAVGGKLPDEAFYYLG